MQLAHSRYWAAANCVCRMRDDWVDDAGSLFSFCAEDPAIAADVLNLKHIIVKEFSQRFSGIVGIDVDDARLLDASVDRLAGLWCWSQSRCCWCIGHEVRSPSVSQGSDGEAHKGLQPTVAVLDGFDADAGGATTIVLLPVHGHVFRSPSVSCADPDGALTASVLQKDRAWMRACKMKEFRKFTPMAL